MTKINANCYSCGEPIIFDNENIECVKCDDCESINLPCRVCTIGVCPEETISGMCEYKVEYLNKKNKRRVGIVK